MRTIKVRGSAEEVVVGKIVCVGRNYAEHAREMQSEVPQTPILFLKPSTAIIRDGEDIVCPRISRQLHHEVELVVAIGMPGKNIPESRARDHILGYAVGLDMTLRDVQSEAKNKGLPWSVAKGFDTSAPVSEIISASMIEDPHKLEIMCLVNGVVRQRTTTDKMILSIDKMIAYISTIFTLERGDLVFTGTPEGVGALVAGDTIRAELVGWTTLTNRVKMA